MAFQLCVLCISLENSGALRIRKFPKFRAKEKTFIRASECLYFYFIRIAVTFITPISWSI